MSFSSSQRTPFGTNTNNSKSLEIESWCYVSHQNYSLQVMQKNETTTNRLKIPASLMEKLAYYRASVCSVYKTLYVTAHHVNFNSFLGRYVFNTLTKTVPTSYVYSFLSYYVPEEHLFLSKMVPLFHGLSWSIILAGFLDLAAVTDGLCLMLDYAIYSILYQSPWNQCSENFTKIKRGKVYCYNLEDFRHKVANENFTFRKYAFQESEGQMRLFDVATTQFLRTRAIFMKEFNTYFLLHYMSIWFLAGMCYQQIFRKYIWKTLNVVQLFNTTGLVIAIIQLLLSSEQGKGSKIPPQTTELTPLLLDFEMHLFAESTTAPPVIHVLNARTTQPINPTSDISVMILSNMIYFVARSILFDKLKTYCESIIQVPIEFTYLNTFAIFTTWPIYFSFFHFGDLYACMFFVSYFIMDLLTFIITYQILVEVVVCEYPKIKRWMVTIFYTVVITFVYVFTTSHDRLWMYFYSKGIVSLIEITAIVYMYPLERLVDDVTYSYGAPPSKFIIYLLKCVPFLYFYKFYTTINSYITILRTKRVLHLISHCLWSWIIPLIPIIFGFIYIIYMGILKKKQSWRMMFRPMQLWGPRDHILRQLRKQYDSRDFIRSQSSRYLSRCLTAKAAAQTYKLAVYYNRGGRRSTVTQENTNISPSVAKI